MSHLINKSETKKRQSKLSTQFLALCSVILLISVSTIALYAYQQKSKIPELSVINAQADILKQQILQQSDVVDTNWLHTLNPLVKKVRGRLLWSSSKQQGLMEFDNLPTLSKGQRFVLLIYDLNTETTNPIKAVFEHKQKTKGKKLLIPFTAEEEVTNPLKFELILDEEGVDTDLQLLLAQP